MSKVHSNLSGQKNVNNIWLCMFWTWVHLKISVNSGWLSPMFAKWESNAIGFLQYASIHPHVWNTSAWANHSVFKYWSLSPLWTFGAQAFCSYKRPRERSPNAQHVNEVTWRKLRGEKICCSFDDGFIRDDPQRVLWCKLVFNWEILWVVDVLWKMKNGFSPDGWLLVSFVSCRVYLVQLSNQHASCLWQAWNQQLGTLSHEYAAYPVLQDVSQMKIHPEANGGFLR